MGDICYSWIYKPTLSIVVILLSVTCVMQCSENPATIENVYPRGNHWAVGHLMGKKSLDTVSGAWDRAHGTDRVKPSDEAKPMNSYENPSRLSRFSLRTLVGLEDQGQTPPKPALLRSRLQEEQERERVIQQLASFLPQDLNIQENNSR